MNQQIFQTCILLEFGPDLHDDCLYLEKGWSKSQENSDNQSGERIHDLMSWPMLMEYIERLYFFLLSLQLSQ